MEMDTDVLRSSYLADITDTSSYTILRHSLWERTRCPDPVVVKDADADQYGVEVVHVENTAFHDGEEYRVTCNMSADGESRSYVIDLDPEQTTPTELGKDHQAVIDLDSAVISSADVRHTSGDVARLARNCSKGRRKQQVPKAADEYIDHVKSTEDKVTCQDTEQVTCQDTVQNAAPENNDVHVDKSITRKHSSDQMPLLYKRKISTEKPHLPPVRFRFGHYPYDQKKQKECEVSSISKHSDGFTDLPIGGYKTTRDAQAKCHRSWIVPENRLKSGNTENQDNPLANLYHYCDAVSSRAGSDLQSLTNELVTEKYNAFMGTMKEPHPRNLEKRRVNGDIRYQPTPNASSSGVNWNSSLAPVHSVPGHSVDNGTIDSLSYGNMLLSYHNDMLYRRRMMMDEWYHVRLHQGPRSWHKPSSSQPPQEAKKSNNESSESSRSRLFGISISRKCDTNCLVTADDKVNNKENLPEKSSSPSSSCDTETPALMDDSGIGSNHENSSFETDTDFPNSLHPNTGSGGQEPTDATAVTAVASVRPWPPLPPCDMYTSPNNGFYRASSAEKGRHFLHMDINSEIARRRKYILEAMHSEYGFNNQSILYPVAPMPPQIPSPQAEVYQPTNQPPLQDFQEPSKAPRTPADDVPCVPLPPLQDDSGPRDTDFVETGDVGFQGQSNMPEALSDFRALVDAFDQSPRKTTAGDDQNGQSYPVLAAALKKKNSKKCSQEVVQSLSKKISKTHTCGSCGRGNLLMKAIRRHKLRKHSCPKCQERFCLRELLHKHLREKACAGIAQYGRCKNA